MMLSELVKIILSSLKIKFKCIVLYKFKLLSPLLMERNQLPMKIRTEEACTLFSLYSLNINGRTSLETVARSGILFTASTCVLVSAALIHLPHN